MSRYHKNLIRLALYALTALGLLWVMLVPVWQVYHIITLVVCVGVLMWHLVRSKKKQ